MVSRLAHRGPDGEGSVEVDGSWLGYCRLALVEGGRQPFESETAGLAMVADGEIYNAMELREASGGKTRDSIECAMHLLAAHGPAALAELNGQFALAGAGRDGWFVAARDRFGLKPLYWARRGEQVVFASELGAFDEDWMPLVESFPPGHAWTPEDGLVRFVHATPDATARAASFTAPEAPGDDIPEPILAAVRAQLGEAVDRQMMGDVPIGAFLSGGLDSSIIAALGARWLEVRGERLKTFAVGFEGAPDLAAARVVAEHLGTEHFERTYTADEALEILPEVVGALENFDPSLVRSSVPNAIVAELAARHVTVVLSGEGADEIFGGYAHMEALDSPVELQRELVRGIEGGHNNGFQRVDRTTMMHGLQARMPFMDRDMVELGLSIPAGWKLAGNGVPEKRVLREAFRGWLPEEVLWRKKAQFGDGSGAIDVLQDRMMASVARADFMLERGTVEPPLRTREEAAYHRIFAGHFPGARAEHVVGRFITA